MNRKYFVYPLLILLFYILQYVATPLSYNGVTPDYLLIAVIVAAVRESERFAAVTGLVTGLLADYTCGLTFGLRGILFMLTGYFLAVLVYEALSPNIITATVAGITSYVFTRLVYWGEYLVMMGSFSVKEMLLSVTLPELIMTLPLVPVIFTLTVFLTGGRRSDGADSARRRFRGEAI